MYITMSDNDGVYVYPLLPERQWYLTLKGGIPAIYLGNEYGEMLLTKDNTLCDKWPSKQIAVPDMQVYYGVILHEMANAMATGATHIDINDIADVAFAKCWDVWGNAGSILDDSEGVCH